ncbi:MAG TPA: biotin carboxylase N-terminal domain-containing protein, partial [Alphaproteobacteria bacterium]|nr:biotin carboxylase N-terminal domain-containing protein [Alphaproteobacteria bacterium]
LIRAARLGGADCVHPGYGFLAENAAFAEQCAAAGLAFIGPPAEAVRLMGDKSAAKQRMQEVGVPCVPGCLGEDQAFESLERAAATIGLPLMIKAAAGGGGRGMRLVRDDAELAGALRAARSEARSAFGNGDLILEKAVSGARHVEVQVFADRHGNVIHLGERDCSIQRRHQKVLEEAPSPAVDAELRQRMGEAACQAAAAIGYVGAGTVEFLLDGAGNFYFMEMNTRLQVEHAVTEMITGLDLVAWQFRVAWGETLSWTQEEVTWNGHAIEARLCAEDAAAGFRPEAGRVLDWRPRRGTGIRIDDGLGAGVDISPYYDSLLGRIIAHGSDRAEAITRLHKCIRESVLFGVTTNRPFLLWVLDHPAFLDATHDIEFIDRCFEPSGTWFAPPDDPVPALASLLLFLGDRRGSPAPLARDRDMSWPVAFSGKGGAVTATVQLLESGYSVVVGESRLDFHDVDRDEETVTFVAGGLRMTVPYCHAAGVLYLDLEGRTFAFTEQGNAQRSAGAAPDDARVTSPMSGRVIDVHVEAGQAVTKGDVLVVVEAMKMQHSLIAPRDATVQAVSARIDETVDTGALLLTLDDPPRTPG